MSLHYDLLPGDLLCGYLQQTPPWDRKKGQKRDASEGYDYFVVIKRSTQHKYSSLGLTGVVVFNERVGVVTQGLGEATWLTLSFLTEQDRERYIARSERATENSRKSRESLPVVRKNRAMRTSVLR